MQAFGMYSRLPAHANSHPPAFLPRLEFKVGEQPVDSFRMIEIHYFKVRGGAQATDSWAGLCTCSACTVYGFFGTSCSWQRGMPLTQPV